MRLYLMRHGHAEPATPYLSDAERALTPRGKKRVANAAALLAALSVAPDHIYSSPRIRARQTADIVSEALKVPVEVRPEVDFGFGVPGIQVLTRDVSPTGTVMFVGHEPSLSGTVAELTGADITMKKGGLARVDILDRTNLDGELVWLIAPKVFDVAASNRK